MRAINVKCPECGAALSSASNAATTTCQYCGTTARIQRRSRFLEVPVNIPESQAPPHLPVAVQKHSSNWLLLIILTITLGAGGIPALCVYRAVSKERAKRATPKWHGTTGVAVRDLNGDGVLDAIGRLRSFQPSDVVYIGAFDGKSGKRLWKSQKLGKGSELSNTPMALAGDAIVVANKSAQLIGLTAKDGALRWTIRLSEKVEKLCQSKPPGTIAVKTADKRFHQVTLASGAIAPADSMGVCVPLPGDQKDGGNPEVLTYEWHNDYGALVPRTKIPGIDADAALHHVPTGITIGLGHKNPGSRIPTIVSYRWPDTESEDPEQSMSAARRRLREAKSQADRLQAMKSMRDALKLRRQQRDRKPEKIWLAQVPGVDPMSVAENSVEPQHVDTNGAQVVVVYETKKTHAFRITAFDARSGKRLWDSGISGDRPFTGVRTTSTHAMVSRWGGLHVYDIKTGAHAYTIH